MKRSTFIFWSSVFMMLVFISSFYAILSIFTDESRPEDVFILFLLALFSITLSTYFLSKSDNQDYVSDMLVFEGVVLLGVMLVGIVISFSASNFSVFTFIASVSMAYLANIIFSKKVLFNRKIVIKDVKEVIHHE